MFTVSNETTMESLKELAPAVFRSKEDGAKLGASKHYEFMTTHEIVDGLADMGWNIRALSQQKSKKNPETTKHMVRFQNPNLVQDKVNGNVPEIVLVNSHDRTSSLNFHVGVFRLVCSNGLIVADSTINKFKVRHMGVNFDDIKNDIIETVKDLPDVYSKINKFERRILSEVEQKEFTTRAFALRYPQFIDPKSKLLDIERLNKSVNIYDVLMPKISADYGNTMWQVFNRVQYNLINGGFDCMVNGEKPRKSRPITNISTNVKINKGLWELADAFSLN